jgi:hypothetical protein
VSLVHGGWKIEGSEPEGYAVRTSKEKKAKDGEPCRAKVINEKQTETGTNGGLERGESSILFIP